MKIGELAHLFNLSTQAIRYYIKVGLIVPESKGAQYQFNQQNVEDLKLILKLKQYDFSISDIHDVLTLKRISNLKTSDSQDKYRAILRNKLSSIAEEQVRLRKVTSEIEAELKTLSTTAAPTQKERGIPLCFLPLLCCPTCGTTLDISNMQIRDQQIISGDLHCGCGYRAKIEHGILLVEGGHVPEREIPDLSRSSYNDSSAALVTLYQKSYNWILNQLSGIDLAGKVVFENLINCCCFLATNINQMSPDALYIVADRHREVIELYKEFFEQQTSANILFIVAPSHRYPLKSHCIDLYIDYLSTLDYMTYESGDYRDVLRPFLRPQADVVGAWGYFAPRSRSYRQFRTQFPESQESTFKLDAFLDFLRSQPIRMLGEQYTGHVTDSGQGGLCFSFHIPGDKLSFYTFHYRYLQGT